MNNKVTETKAGKAISAFVILNKKGKHIATVRAHYSDAGRVTVNVFDFKTTFQAGSASGYGYDKFTAALRGLTIDGHKMCDHCETDEKTKAILKSYLSGKIADATAKRRAERIGASFANFDGNSKKWQSLYYISGLDMLRAIGYTVIQAI
jgi:hypothetical protein